MEGGGREGCNLLSSCASAHASALPIHKECYFIANSANTSDVLHCPVSQRAFLVRFSYENFISALLSSWVWGESQTAARSSTLDTATIRLSLSLSLSPSLSFSVITRGKIFIFSPLSISGLWRPPRRWTLCLIKSFRTKERWTQFQGRPVRFYLLL